MIPAPTNKNCFAFYLQSETEIPEEAAHDQARACVAFCSKRSDKMRAFFDSVADRLGKDVTSR